MKVTIDIPESMERVLCSQRGQNLEQATRESLVIAWYQSEKISIGQVAEMLGISVNEAEGLMKAQHVDAPYSLKDYESDRATLNRLLNL